MAKLRLVGVLLLCTWAGQAQRQMTVEQLISFIRSSIQMRNDDRRVADFVRNIKLTEKLEARTVEELQGLGAGQRTVAALKSLVTASAALPAAAPPAPSAPVVTIPPPSPAELKQILAELTQNALNYTKNLPNFICTQVTRRRADPTGSDDWRLMDTIQERLSYSDNKEDYQVVLWNNRAVNNVSHSQLGGVTSSGEFGTMLSQIFSPKANTEFEWERWATLRSRRMYVFSFRVRQANSEYSIYHQPSGRTIVAGYHGLIYADRDTKMVMRIRLDCDLPLDFPIQQVSLDLNYDFTQIADQEFVLPLKADLRSKEGRLIAWNEVEFRLYRKFSTEASIVFDTPEPIPEDQLQEQPVQPDPAPKK
jgi:hypothetical protein